MMIRKNKANTESTRVDLDDGRGTGKIVFEAKRLCPTNENRTLLSSVACTSMLPDEKRSFRIYGFIALNIGRYEKRIRGLANRCRGEEDERKESAGGVGGVREMGVCIGV